MSSTNVTLLFDKVAVTKLTPGDARITLKSGPASSYEKLSPEELEKIERITGEIDRSAKEQEYQDTILALRDTEAEQKLDELQWWLDNTPRSHSHHRLAIYLMVRLCAHSNLLPPSLYIGGVSVPDKRNINFYGGNADVFEGTFEGRPVAVKRIRVRPDARDSYNKTLTREALIWRQLRHRHLLPFIGLDKVSFNPNVALVSLWMLGGTLKKYMETPAYKAERDAVRMLYEVALGASYLHANKIAHGDINDVNVLVDAQGHACLADFGLVVIGDTTQGRPTVSGNASGTTSWMAPERHDGTPRAPPVDVFAFACLCYKMCTGKRLYHEERSDNAVLNLILKGERPEIPDPGAGGVFMPEGMKDVIRACWAQYPEARPTMRDVIFAFGFNNGNRLLRRCIFSSKAETNACDVKNGYLNFSRGDAFDVLSLHENDWVVRDAAGNFGLVPFRQCENRCMFTATAIEDWDPSDEDSFRMLPLKKDQVVSVMAFDGPNWYVQAMDIKTGFIPATAVDITRQFTPRLRMGEKMDVVAKQSISKASDELPHALTFAAGETLIIATKPSIGEWCAAQNAAGDIGLVHRDHFSFPSTEKTEKAKKTGIKSRFQKLFTRSRP